MRYESLLKHYFWLIPSIVPFLFILPIPWPVKTKAFHQGNVAERKRDITWFLHVSDLHINPKRAKYISV